MEYFKEFDVWNNIKKITDSKFLKQRLFKERDIWWTSIGVNIGYEEDGKKPRFVPPVLIIKKFSKDLFFGIPLSTKNKKNVYYYKISVKDKTVSVLMSQARVFSAKRLQNRLEVINYEDFILIILKLQEILFSPPTN